MASVLEMAGIEATKLDGTFDLLAVTPAGTIISVEVKTRATVSYSDVWRFGRGEGAVQAHFLRHLRGEGRSQWFALYCVPLGVVRFFRSDDPKHKRKMFNVRSAEFTGAAQAADLETLLSL